MPADAQALDETSSVVSSINMIRYFGADFLGAGFVAVGVGVDGVVVAGVVVAGAVVELGVPTSVGVLAVFVVVSFLFLRVAIIAQVIPATKIIKAIIKVNLTVLDMDFSIPIFSSLSRLKPNSG